MDPTITIHAPEPGCKPLVTVSPAPTTEREIIEAIERVADVLRERSLAAGLSPKWIRRNASEYMLDAAGHVLRTLVPDGLLQWLVRPEAGESTHTYARRASRYLAARCAQAGVSTPPAVAHEGAQTLGMLGGHVGREMLADVSQIERDRGAP